jgi:FMN phosphatase YigB (HAD superfamily)
MLRAKRLGGRRGITTSSVLSLIPDAFVVVKVHSFDVFDTSLIRKIATPPDVFRLLGRLVAKKANIADESNFTEDFLTARIQSEQKSGLNCDETALDAIWTYLREMVPQLPRNVGPHDELDLERKLLRPNLIVAQQIARLRSSGARIIFTSDTFYSEAFVREQLLRFGLTEAGDRLYVSSAAGVTKWSGELFKTILNSEGITARELHHYGDDLQSDVVTPRRLGIGATLITNSYLNTWENAILSKGFQHRLPTSMLAGSMRAFRLDADFKSTKGVNELVATLLGPVLLVWAAWVLAAAQRDGVRRLYFVSRDAYLLCRAARILASRFGDIECRHLRISRQSTLLPAADEVGPSEVIFLQRPSQPVSIGSLAEKLSLDWSDVGQYFSTLTGAKGESWLLTKESEWNEFWAIIQREPVANRLREQIKIKRTNLLAYLRAEGLCDNVPAALVDLGWYMQVQTALRKLLENGEGVPAPRGYYLGLCAQRRPPGDAGNFTGLFYEQASYHRWVAPQYEIFRRLEVLDHVVGLAPYGTVNDYRISGSIVEPAGPPETALHAEFVTKLGDAVEAFCKSNYEDALYYSNDATAREIIDTLIRAWCIHPDWVALEALEHIMVTDGANIPSGPLLASWRLFDAIKALLPGRLRERLGIKVYNPAWPEVAFIRSSLLSQLVLMLSAALRFLRGRSDLELFTLFFRIRS